MKIVNLTAHEVVLENGFIRIAFQPSGNVARIEAVQEKANIEYPVSSDTKIKLPIHQTPQVRVINLPKEKEGTYYIVSSYVAQAVKRKDLLAPLTDSSAVRDELGKVISVKMFQQFLEQEILEVQGI